jgi:DNA-binding NarL/FixJ family response regulator
MAACTSVLIVEPRDVLCLGLASMVASNPDVGRYRCSPTFGAAVPTANGAASNGTASNDAASNGSASNSNGTGSNGAASNGSASRDDHDGGFDVAIASVDVYTTATVPACRTIALIESTTVHDLEAAAQVHADGYLLLAETTAEALRAAVRDVMDGRMALPQVLSAHLLDRARRPDAVAASRSVRLSPREEDVLALLVAGLSNKQIARQLDISIHGAKRHVSSVLNKYNAPSRSYLISQSLQLGLARPPKALLVGPGRGDAGDSGSG